MRIGITGYTGFIGTHLAQRIVQSDEFWTCVPIFKSDFADAHSLRSAIAGCDVIIHLAAVIRHPSESFIYNENIRIAQLLIHAIHHTSSVSRVIYLSSVKNCEDSAYGRSKKEIENLLFTCCSSLDIKFQAVVAPNVFGPMSRPGHNSFIATFCDAIQKGSDPVVIQDELIPLLYIDDLVSTLKDLVRHGEDTPKVNLHAKVSMHVSEVKRILKDFEGVFLQSGEIPAMDNDFRKHLFLTFLSFVDIQRHYPCRFDIIQTGESTFAELVRSNSPGQTSYSVIKPGVVRGNHYHTRKFERFIVLKGSAEIVIRKFNETEIHTFQVQGATPSFIDIPPWHVHSIKNIGTDELIVIYWINECFNGLDSDTFPLSPLLHD